MKSLILLAALLTAASSAAAQPLPVKACVKWSRDIPSAQTAGAGLFESVARVEGKGPFADCGVVAETESFGVGWFMRAWMKEGVYSPCGRRLGGFTFHYKGDQWQTTLMTKLHEFLEKRPDALAAAKTCAEAAPLPEKTTP